MYFNTLKCSIAGLIALILLLSGCSPAAEATELISTTTRVIPITIPYPHAPSELNLDSELPGMLRLIGYSGSDFVTGTVEVSNDDWVPETKIDYSKAEIIQKARTNIAGTQELTNLWKLRVGDRDPFRLELHNAQAEGHWNLSGLPITTLDAELGSGKNAFTFDQPNPTVMQEFELHCGTGDVVVEGILNAVCQNMTVQAGEGNLTLRFGENDILQDIKLVIKAGIGTINIAVPPQFPVRITVASTGRVNLGNGLIRLDGASNIYETPSYQAASGKAIEISISGGSGTINLNPPPS